MSIDLNKPYNPGMADIGKFAEIVAPSVSSYGHYAVLTIDAGSLPASAGGLGGPLGTQADPIWTNFTTVVSAVEVSLSGVQMSEVVSAVNCVVSTIEMKPNTLWIGTSSFGVSGVLTQNFATPIKIIEIQNKTTSTIYFIPSATNYVGVVDNGIEIPQDTYYSLKDVTLNNVTVASLTSGKVVILDYY